MYTNKLKKILLPLITIQIIMFLSPLPVSAQSDSNTDNIYFINSFDYNVDGITRNYALDYKTKFTVGEEFSSIADMDQCFSDVTQILINERLFDSVEIEYTIGNAGDDGKYPVDLIVNITDTNNLIIVPFPEYSSNDGLSITLIMKDNNFFGTMSPIKVNIGYQNNRENLNFFTFSVDTEIPVKLFGLYWNINFDHDFHYSPDMPSPWYYKNTTGVSAEIPIERTTLTAGFSESLFYNHEHPRRYWKDASIEVQDGFYMSSNPFFSWEIPTGFFFIQQRLNILLESQVFSAMSSISGL